MNINLFLEYQGLFYSKVDEQVESEEGERLRQFEERMFQNVKNQIEKERKSQWQGSDDENKFADEKIITIVQKALEKFI